MTQDFTSANPAGSAPPTGRHDIRNLRRSRDDRMIGGVCGGLGRYLGIDPIILRIVLAALAIFGGIGLLLYALAWLFVAEEGSDASEAQRLFHGRATPLTTIAALVVGGLGVLALTDIAYHGDRSKAVIFILIAVIVVIAINRRRSQRMPAANAGASWSSPPPYAPHYVAPTATPYSTTPYATPAPGSYPPLGPPAGFAPSRPVDAPIPAGPALAPKPPKEPRPPSVLGPLALSAGIVVIGVLFALNASDSLDISAQTILAAALLTIGIALVIGAWIGRARGIIAVGVLLTIALAIAAAVDVPLRGGIGNRFVNPTHVSELPAAYHLGIGEQTIDLTGLAVGGRTAVTANVGIGRLLVDVPDNVKIVVRARAGAGDVRLFGDETGGTQIDRREIWSPPAGTTARGELDLDLRSGIGRVDVEFVPANGVAPSTPPVPPAAPVPAS